MAINGNDATVNVEEYKNNADEVARALVELGLASPRGIDTNPSTLQQAARSR